jgi:hypothetical protein
MSVDHHDDDIVFDILQSGPLVVPSFSFKGE